MASTLRFGLTCQNKDNERDDRTPVFYETRIQICLVRVLCHHVDFFED